jgi:hypothetical protein
MLLASHDVLSHTTICGQPFDHHVLAEANIGKGFTANTIAASMLEQHYSNSLTRLPSFGSSLAAGAHDSTRRLVRWSIEVTGEKVSSVSMIKPR